MVYADYDGINTQRRVKAPDIARPGQPIYDRITVPFLNAGAETAQEVLIDVGTEAADTPYTFTINGQTFDISYVLANGDPWNNVPANTAVDPAIMLARLMSGLERLQAYFRMSSPGAGQILLTNDVPGINTTVVVAGGGAGFAINTDTPANASSHVPFGRLVVELKHDEYGVLGGLPSPDAGGAFAQKILGFSRRDHAHYRARYSEHRSYGVPLDGVYPREAGSAQREGGQWVECEAAFTGAETDVFFRFDLDPADPDLKAIGALAPAAGAGLEQLAGCRIDGPSQVIEGGIMVVPIAFDLVV